MKEQEAVRVIGEFFKDVIETARDSEEAQDEVYHEVVEELELTRKEQELLKHNFEGATFHASMLVLEKAIKAGYYLFENEIKFFLDFLFEERYNRKYRNVKAFIKARKE